MKVCSKCHVKKAGRHFNHDADGVPHQACKKCDAAAEGAAVVRAQRRERMEPEPEPTTEDVSESEAIAEFSLAAGWLARVKLVPCWLHIVQERQDEGDDQSYMHDVKLLPSQARALMDHIGTLLAQYEQAA